MPLTYIQDYAGAFTRTPADQALVLNAIAARDPEDGTQALEGAGWEGRRPAEWSSALNSEALQGKTIGWYPAAFKDPFGTTDTSDRMKEEFKYFVQAGANVVEIEGPPSPPSRSEYFSGDTNYEGWLKWIQGEPNSPYTDPAEIIDSQLKLPAYRRSTPYSGSGAMTEEQIEGFVAYRKAYEARLEAWMAEEGVDAVVFPGELSNIHLNDSVAPSFGRLDPQSSNSGVPTVIFPAGTNSDGQPGNLQLEGPDYSDYELLGMAYAFEQRAHGHVETSYAPALRYDPASIAEPVSATPAPPSESTPPPPPAGGSGSGESGSGSSGGSESSGSAGGEATPPAPPAPRGKLVHGRFRKGKLLLTFHCASKSGPCSFFVRVSARGAKVGVRQVTIAAGGKKTVGMTPRRKARRRLAHHRHAKIVVRMIPVSARPWSPGGPRFAPGSRRREVGRVAAAAGGAPRSPPEPGEAPQSAPGSITRLAIAKRTSSGRDSTPIFSSSLARLTSIARTLRKSCSPISRLVWPSATRRSSSSSRSLRPSSGSASSFASSPPSRGSM